MLFVVRFSAFLAASLQSYSWAQASPAPAQPSMIDSLLPLFLIFGVFYFFVIRPQGKQRKQHSQFIQGLKRGDEVITASGILGTIQGLTETFVTLEIAPQVQIKILKSQIAGSPKENKA